MVRAVGGAGSQKIVREPQVIGANGPGDAASNFLRLGQRAGMDLKAAVIVVVICVHIQVDHPQHTAQVMVSGVGGAPA